MFYHPPPVGIIGLRKRKDCGQTSMKAFQHKGPSHGAISPAIGPASSMKGSHTNLVRLVKPPKSSSGEKYSKRPIRGSCYLRICRSPLICPPFLLSLLCLRRSLPGVSLFTVLRIPQLLLEQLSRTT